MKFLPALVNFQATLFSDQKELVLAHHCLHLLLGPGTDDIEGTVGEGGVNLTVVWGAFSF